ncbi:MAG: hypothetical protein IJX17_04610 [Clostridia bacterium]|nr:hypothetical protein [Clostridia bacterium]
MNSNILNAKCQNCGSELVYNTQLMCLTCKYCQSNVFLPKKNEKAVLVRQYSASFHPNQLNQSLRTYECNACKTKYYMSSEEKSEKCPNCGLISSTIVEDPGYCADGIIPFKIDKEKATAEFVKYLRKNKGMSAQAKKEAKEKKLLNGVFVPVWNFQFNIDATYSASATVLKQYSDGTYYSVYKPVYGEKHKRIKSLDQSATSHESEEFLKLFSEEDYNSIIPYTPEYTYGYQVDTIDRSIHDYYYTVIEKAELEMKEEIKKKVLSSYKEISNLSVDSRANDVFFNFTYIPVYVYTYTRKNKKTEKIYVSGTTGKVIGASPKTPAKFFGGLFKFLFIIAIIVFLYMVIQS